MFDYDYLQKVILSCLSGLLGYTICMLLKGLNGI